MTAVITVLVLGLLALFWVTGLTLRRGDVTRYRWWHQIRRHKTRDRFDLIAAPYAWECETCDVIWGHY